jgi:predicted adenylyl cyclase CyaB
MARNVEIKASLHSVRDFIERVSQIADSGPENIEQDDTFFMCDKGRLKLRVFSDGTGELIFYKRLGNEGPRTSHYEIAQINDIKALRTVLSSAYGQVGRVRKLRTVYMVGRTRVHIDQVEGLGTFVELEVVLKEGENEDNGAMEARDLMKRLGVMGSSLIDRPYVELINKRGT